MLGLRAVILCSVGESEGEGGRGGRSSRWMKPSKGLAEGVDASLSGGGGGGDVGAVAGGCLSHRSWRVALCWVALVNRGFRAVRSICSGREEGETGSD